MKTARTEITINAAPQTVWSTRYDLDHYPEWNKVLPKAASRTTVGQTLSASMAFSGMGEPQQFAPELTLIVGARERRWVDDQDHHFYGLDFFHPELGEGNAPKIEFASFVSSLIEGGVSPTRMTPIRRRLGSLGIPCFDSFSPELMDVIAWHKVKLARQQEAP